MVQPNVLLLRAPGTNCDAESAFAFEQAGAKTERMHINRVFEQPSVLDRFQILCIPGGFSYGDDIAAGQIFGRGLRQQLGPAMSQFRDDGKLVLGICNGFQVLIRSGLLFDDDPLPTPPATLAWNEHGRYEDRWVQLATRESPCVFLEGIDQLELPIAHAEGRFVARDEDTLYKLDESGRLPLRYVWRSGAMGDEVGYPDNPNGSQLSVAGACDATGRVFGLMPHPERFIDPTQHPQWTRRPTVSEGDGMAIFRNAVNYFTAG
jgi:phosphoribosylformylglycinamidine synthase